MSKAMNTCEQVKETLVTTGREGIGESGKLQEHVQNCLECRRLLRAWAQIPELLDQMPEHEPDEAIVRKITQNLTAPDRAITARRRFLAPSLASAAVLLAAIGLSRELLLHEAPKAPVTVESHGAMGQSVNGPDLRLAADRLDDAPRSGGTQIAAEKPQASVRSQLEESADYRAGQEPAFRAQPDDEEYEVSDRVAIGGAWLGGETPSEPAPESGAGAPEFRKKTQQKPAASHAEPVLRNERQSVLSSASRRTPEAPPQGLLDKQPGSKAISGSAKPGSAESTDKDGSQLKFREGSEPAADSEVDSGTASVPKDVAQITTPLPELPDNATTAGSGGYAYFGDDARTNVALNFLEYYQKIDGLKFRKASGYWANTYIPGDPEIRWLGARLAQWDRSWLNNQGDLEQSVKPVEQPFDAPEANALSLNLMADTNAVMREGATHKPTRLRLQVGIRGIEHRRGQRPAMNVGVVVDLPADAPDPVRIASRALLDALLQSKQAGDRFSLVVTGQPGLVVQADDFRFGPLQLARQLILGQQAEQPQSAGPGPEFTDVDLYGAIELAGNLVQENDDPSRPLGSSAVLLVSARNIDRLDQILALTHQRARAGISLSVFPLGNEADRDQADRMALAGLGNRRFLQAPDEARQLIEEELHASSRAVARAARLSIRLAPGVKLIGVVGSQPLDAARAQRVREIETSMDRRLAANLGIHSDRGVDEEGIQILIPTIYSGDSVTVLVDVVTDHPGAIADVSLRYKDLVFLRNGSLQSRLTLPEGKLKRGPAELAVLKNLLAHHFALAVRQAAAALGRQQAGEAAGILRAMQATLEQVRREVPAWEHDPDIIRDQHVLDQYIAALTSPQAGAHQSFLARSLQYAAWAKTHRSLEEWK